MAILSFKKLTPLVCACFLISATYCKSPESGDDYIGLLLLLPQSSANQLASVEVPICGKYNSSDPNRMYPSSKFHQHIALTEGDLVNGLPGCTPVKAIESGNNTNFYNLNYNENKLLISYTKNNGSASTITRATGGNVTESSLECLASTSMKTRNYTYKESLISNKNENFPAGCISDSTSAQNITTTFSFMSGYIYSIKVGSNSYLYTSFIADSDNRITSYSYQGQNYTVSYNADGTVSSISGSGSSPEIRMFTYDSSGLLTNYRYYIGLTLLQKSDYQYDSSGRLTQKIYADFLNNVTTTDYTY